MWSHAGQLDWWVKNGSSGWARCAVPMVVRSGSKLLTFVGPERADDRGSLFSFVVRRVFTQCRIRLSEWIISLRFDMHPKAFLCFPSRLARSSR
jgi:hypothetical protein